MRLVMIIIFRQLLHILIRCLDIIPSDVNAILGLAFVESMRDKPVVCLLQIEQSGKHAMITPLKPVKAQKFILTILLKT